MVLQVNHHEKCFKFQLNDGRSFQVVARFDTDVELTYFHHGGILNYMIRTMLWSWEWYLCDPDCAVTLHSEMTSGVFGGKVVSVSEQ